MAGKHTLVRRLCLAAALCAGVFLLVLALRADRAAPGPPAPPPVETGGDGEAPPVLPEKTAAPPGDTVPVEAAPVPSPPNPPEEAPPRPGKLVPLYVTTDGAVYSPGEPVRIRMVFRNPGPGPVRVTPEGDVSGHDNFVISTPKSSYGYAPERPKDLPTVGPGDIYEYECVVEIREVGPVTIEGGYPRFASRERGAKFSVKVEVVDREGREHLEAKIERLARRIEEEEDLWDPAMWTQAQKDMRTVGRAAVPRLRRMLRESTRPQARAVAAKLLSLADGREAIPDLVAALEDASPEVREMCVEALGRFKATETFGALLPLLDDSEYAVRLKAVGSVAGFGLSKAGQPLRRALRDPELFVRTLAAIRLAEQGDDTGAEVLVEALRKRPTFYASMVVPALEKVSGASFGRASNPMVLSNMEQMGKASEECETVARKWIEWWETGRLPPKEGEK